MNDYTSKQSALPSSTGQSVKKDYTEASTKRIYAV